MNHAAYERQVASSTMRTCCVSRVTFVPTVGYDHQFEGDKTTGDLFQTLEVNADLELDRGKDETFQI